jgi:hypothetical protein
MWGPNKLSPRNLLTTVQINFLSLTAAKLEVLLLEVLFFVAVSFVLLTLKLGLKFLLQYTITGLREFRRNLSATTLCHIASPSAREDISDKNNVYA